MDAVCKMTGEATTWPCSAPGCPLYGDCLSEYAGSTKPMTNADRIRAMSDEELAKWLEYEGGGACAEVCGWLNWLQQPAEEEP